MTGNRNTTPGDGLRAFALAALMVLSVATVGIALGANVQRGGTAAANQTFNPGVGGPSNVVVDQSKPVVFQGEEDINFVDADGNPVQASQLIGVAGNAEGQPLEQPIPRDQALGQYAINGQADQAGVTVQRPRVSDLNVYNTRGVDVAGSSVQEDEVLLVRGEWNFQQAEDLELVVRDENGNDITGDVLTSADALSDAQRNQLSGPYARFPQVVSNPGQRGTGTGIVYLQGIGQFSDRQIDRGGTPDAAYWALDLSDQDAGDYTITVQGWDNLDFGAASRTTSLTVTSENDVTLDLADDSVTRGQDVRYTIRGSTAGARHYVVIEDDDFRNNRVDVNVFRDIQDVIDSGTYDTNDDGTPDFAWAQVEISEDTGLGVGQIDTSYLDDSSVKVNLYQADRALDDLAANLGNTEDDKTLDVNQGTLEFESPAGTYIAGQNIDVTGFAAPGVDDVAIYARDQGDWELVDINENGQLDNGDTIRVDSTGEWKRRDVVLSQASDILSIPGRYRIGVVEAQDATDDQGDLMTTLTTSEFSSATSSQTSIIVQEPGLEDTRSFRAINGQIAVEDGNVDVRGVAPGLDEVLVVMVDSRGRVATDRVTVNDDDTFDKDNVPLQTVDGRNLNEGSIQGIILGLGRDGVAGDGILPGETRADLGALEDYINSIGSGLTQRQVVERINDETTDEVASDDLALRESFRYTDGSTSIETVRPAGENVTGVQTIEIGQQVEIVGLTNRKPDDNTISVEAIDGPSVDQFDSGSTDTWGLDGVWTITLSTDGVDPGLYTIEADDGDNTDTVQVRLVEPQEPTPTATPTPTPANETATPTPTPTSTPTNETATPTPSPTETNTTG